MSVSGPIKIINDGLVLAIDEDNIKSNVGIPVKNVMSTLSLWTNYSATGISATGGMENAYIPDLNTYVNSWYCDFQNDYPATSSNCCPNPGYYGDITVSGSTLYTYMILYRTNNGYTSQNFMYRYEYNSTTYVSEVGVFTTAKRKHLGNEWYWAWNTFTTNAATNRLILYYFYYYYSKLPDRLHIAKAVLLQGDYTGLNPLKWPEPNVTRNVTSCLYDLTGNHSITVANCVFDSSGTILFDGTNSYIPISSVADAFWNAGSWTACAWVKFSAVAKGSDNSIFGHGAANTNNGLHIAERSAKAYFGFYSNDIAGNVTLTTNVWYNLVFSYNNTSKLKTIYVNGAYDSSGGTVGYGGTGTNTEIGRYPWSTSNKLSGYIGMILLYNKCLTVTEVLNNFNSTKTKYGY